MVGTVAVELRDQLDTARLAEVAPPDFWEEWLRLQAEYARRIPG